LAKGDTFHFYLHVKHHDTSMKSQEGSWVQHGSRQSVSLVRDSVVWPYMVGEHRCFRLRRFDETLRVLPALAERLLYMLETVGQ